MQIEPNYYSSGLSPGLSGNNTLQQDCNFLNLSSATNTSPTPLYFGSRPATQTSLDFSNTPSTSRIQTTVESEITEDTAHFFSKNNKIPCNFLKNVLEGCVAGKDLLNRNSARGYLETRDKKKLATIIIHHILTENPNASLGTIDLTALSLQIPTVFKKECSFSYMTTKEIEHPNKIRRTRVNIGHLVDAYTQKSRSLQKENLRFKRRRSTPVASTDTVPEPEPLRLAEFDG